MKLLSVILLIFLLFIIACEDRELLTNADRVSRVRINIVGLNDPGAAAWYESWVLWNKEMGQGTDIDTTSLGILQAQGNGTYRVETDIELGFIQAGLTILVTIEDNDTPGDEPPSDYEIIAAGIAANSGSFSLGNAEILNFKFEEANGTFILDTPTETPSSQNPYSGIWFVNPDTTITDILDDQNNVIGQDTTVEFFPGLELPALPIEPAGWTYEAFVETGGQTVSLGKFVQPSGGDDAATYSGNQPAYPFPGEDLLNNPPAGLTFPVDLRGARAYVTVAPPFPAQGNSPYNVTVFEALIGGNAQARQLYSLTNTSDTFPSGDLSIDVSIYK